jgi:iron uptake system EfeUOB component EfeO/EfeM
MGTRRLRVAAQFAAVGAALAASLVACSSGGGAGQPSNLITVSSGQCGSSWHLSGPGWHTFELYNQDINGGEIDLIDPANGAVYAELENSGPGTTNPMTLDVGSGRYAFLCLFSDSNPIQGAVVTVAGHAVGTKAILPITDLDIIPLAKEYQAYAETGLKVLARQTATLAADVQAGNLTAAKRDWLTAHLQYQTLGAAYDSFGNYDDEVDGRADAVGVNSPQWTGFYRLEYGLWHGQDAANPRGPADHLDTAVRGLQAAFPAMEVDLLDMGLRTHEILENALQFQLSGHDDYGSGTTLASTDATITGSRVLLDLLHPLIAPRYPGLAGVYSGLSQLQSLLEKERLPNGWWVPESALPVATRQAIDAACGQVLQELAPIASITEPRNTVNDF